MKRIAGIFLAALLALTVLPHGAELVTSSEVTKGIVTTAYAEDEHQNHCICGATHRAVGNHEDEDKYTGPWTGISSLDAITGDGYYYLTEDVVVTPHATTAYWVAPKDTNIVLCLNGHTLSDSGTGGNLMYRVIYVDGNTVFTVTDCKDTGKILNSKGVASTILLNGYDYDGHGAANTNPVLNLYAGTITDADGINKSSGVDISYGTLNMYGGTIRGCRHGVDASDGTFNMFDGMITENKAIEGSYSSDKEGGGVRLTYATFNMMGGTISGNAAKYGGGVYMLSHATFNISGSPKVTGNKTPDGKDNNVYLTTSGEGVNAKITVAGMLTESANIGIVKNDSADFAYIEWSENVAKDATKFHVDGNENSSIGTDGKIVGAGGSTGGESGGEQPTTYTVTIVPGEHIKTDGALTQNVTRENPMNNMFFYTADGYYFPEGYTAAQNGVTASYMNPAQIMVTGTPTDNVTLTLPEPGKRLAGTVRIVGTAQVGQTLTAVLENGDVDQSALAYQWEYSDGVLAKRINGATSSTYTLTAQDEGKSIFVQVSKAGEPGGAIYSATVGPIEASSGGEERPETTPRYYYNSTAAADTKADGSKTGSPKTFDAGVGIYAVSAVLSLTGMAYVGKKKF